MKMSEVANLTGLTVRTLRHYENKGLLSPSRNQSNGYRDYDISDLLRLQQIVSFAACGLSLNEIKMILDNPNYCKVRGMELQRDVLIFEHLRITEMLDALDKTIENSSGSDVRLKEMFKGFKDSKSPVIEEIRKTWL